MNNKELKYVPGTYRRKRPDAYTVANQYAGKWKQQLRKKEEAFPAKMSSTICFSREIGVGALEIADILSLLHLGFKGILLGPTLSAFFSPTVVNVLVENFDIKQISTVVEEIEAMMPGKYYNKQWL